MAMSNCKEWQVSTGIFKNDKSKKTLN